MSFQSLDRRNFAPNADMMRLDQREERLARKSTKDGTSKADLLNLDINELRAKQAKNRQKNNNKFHDNNSLQLHNSLSLYLNQLLLLLNKK